jgi:signal transduction histidine kinase
LLLKGFHAGNPRQRKICWLISGLALGAVPWAKLQGLPAVPAMLVLAAVLIFKLQRRGLDDRRTSSAWFVAGLSAATLLLGIQILIAGEVRTFFESYLLNSAGYIQHGAALRRVVFELWDFTRGIGTYPAYLSCCAVAGLTAFVLLRQTRLHWVLLSATAAVVVAFGITLAPMRGFVHYLHFTVAPLAVFAAVGLEVAARRCTKRQREQLVLSGCAVLVTAAMLGVRMSKPRPFVLGKLADSALTPHSDVAKTILHYAQPGDSLAIWGWASGYYVETQLPQAARDAHTQRAIELKPNRDRSRRRFFADFTRARPAVFVDAVAPKAFAFQNTAVDGHDTVPDLKQFVRLNYILVSTSEMARIYIRNDRVPGK